MQLTFPRRRQSSAENCVARSGPNDGFRRKAVPQLLYRYFSAMLNSFKAVRKLVKPRGQFALIVGHNHTVLGGVRFDINTPQHLANLATAGGWHIDELVPLQTYQRYFGYHVSNAIEAETLILLRNS
jgi:site-specific DNA-methyltransferase (cytosine-N4-specific)